MDYNAIRRAKYENSPELKEIPTKESLLYRYKQLSIEEIEHYIAKYTEIIELYKEALRSKLEKNIKDLSIKFKYGDIVFIDCKGNVYCECVETKEFFEGRLANFFAENPKYLESPDPVLCFKEELEAMGADILEYHLHMYKYN